MAGISNIRCNRSIAKRADWRGEKTLCMTHYFLDGYSQGVILEEDKSKAIANESRSPARDKGRLFAIVFEREGIYSSVIPA